MAKDLTQGNPTKLILSFSIPLAFGFLFQQFYNFVDTAVVGKTLGLEALASVGCTGSLNFLLLGFCTGVCSGLSIPVAQAYGAHNMGQLRKYIVNGILVAGVMAVIMCGATVILCRRMLVLMRTPSNIVDNANAYMVIIFAFVPATVLYNYFSGIIRAMGDSRTPVIFLVMASIINIGLDFWFILRFRMGVAGAAFATGISQFAAGIGCLVVFILNRDSIGIKKQHWLVSMHHVWTLVKQGLPMGLQFSITALGSVLLAASVNTLGSSAVAVVTAGAKLSMFFFCVFDALASTIATYSGQNVGAWRIDRIRQGLKSSVIIGAVYSGIAMLIIYFFRSKMLELFISPEETEALTNAQHFLLINGSAYIALLFVNLLRLLIQGVGYTSLAVFAGVSEMIARTVMAIFIVPRFGFEAACFANPSAWVMADVFLFPASIYVLKELEKKKRLMSGMDAASQYID